LDVSCVKAVEEGNPIVGFLAMESDVVSQVVYLLNRKVFIRNLGFLQADESRVMFFDNSF
jgi:hypothetical protein